MTLTMMDDAREEVTWEFEWEGCMTLEWNILFRWRSNFYLSYLTIHSDEGGLLSIPIYLI